MPKRETGRRDPANKAETKKARETDEVVESHRSSSDKANDTQGKVGGPAAGDPRDPRKTGD